MTSTYWHSEKQGVVAGSGARSCLRHVQSPAIAAAYDPAVVGGTAFRMGANGWPTGLLGDPAG